MKKIFFTLVLIMLALSANAQSNQKSSSPMLASSAVNNSVKEDPRNPLVNGIPYNQYKLQVQADQKQRAAKEAETKIQ